MSPLTLLDGSPPCGANAQGTATITADRTNSVTMPGTIMGTFGYMPPEQLRGERTDERSDLFAVGVMIYEALRGEKPFRGNSYHELLRAMTSDEFLFEADRRWTEFFENSLAQETAARFTSAGEMKRVLSIPDFAYPYYLITHVNNPS